MAYSSAWQSPSNIALIKYWGKHGKQLPHNPSLSFTLAECYTEMSVQASLETSHHVDVNYDGMPRPAFAEKIISFFSKLDPYFPWLKNASIAIDSVNSFPHGAGIASSASAMSALALCLQDIDDAVTGHTERNTTWWQRVSEIARLGSGSACRSVFPIAALWGITDASVKSSDEYAIPWKDAISPFYQSFADLILIVSADEKKVSSSTGHRLMENHPYAATRYANANQNLKLLVEALRDESKIELFISVCESEALQLHALMMGGASPYILIEPNTISIMKEVWRYREETGIPVCFTLDAGPNVHILFPAGYRDAVVSWVNHDLIKYCSGGKYILDHVGAGPVPVRINA